MISSTTKRAVSALAVAIALVALPAIYLEAQTDGSAAGGWAGQSGCGGMMGGGERPNQQWRR